MSRLKNIGLITSGGDCGGLNAVIRGAASIAISKGIGTYIIPNGYAGLYNLIDFEKLTLMDEERTDRILSSIAGSEAGHSRVKISKINDPEKYHRIISGLRKFNIDGLIISGGDDTGSVVIDLAENGIPCVHAPKTMDLDLQTYSVGGDSTVNRIANIVNDIKTTGKSHNRVMIVEVFGRYAGHTAFRGGIASDADCILIPEINVDFNVVYKDIKRHYFRRILNSDVYAGTYVIIAAEGVRNEDGELFSEGAGKDSFGHVKLAGAAKYIRSRLSSMMKEDPEIKQFMKATGMYVEGTLEIPEVREIIPGHIVRSGNTSVYDANFGKEAGGAAVYLLEEGITGVTVVDVHDGVIRYIPTKEAIKQCFVNMEQVKFYEQMGICFGREAATSCDFRPAFDLVSTPIRRIY